jgi:hypothetical protein
LNYNASTLRASRREHIAVFLGPSALSPFLFVFRVQLRAQDMPTRVEAAQLLERANGVIRPSHIMPNLKLEVVFRAYGLDGNVKEGMFDAI